MHALNNNEWQKFLTYQLPMLRDWPTVALLDDGVLGFDFGEGAWRLDITFPEGSRRLEYPILTRGDSDMDNTFSEGSRRADYPTLTRGDSDRQ